MSGRILYWPGRGWRGFQAFDENNLVAETVAVGKMLGYVGPDMGSDVGSVQLRFANLRAVHYQAHDC